MFLGLLSFIPLLGPIIDGIVSIWTKAKDTEVAKYKVDGEVHSVEVQASTQTTIAFKDDIGVRFCRDLVMLPGSIWCALYLWDKIVAHHYPTLVYDVAPLDGPLAVLPVALLTFYFGMAAISPWRR